MQKVCMYEKLHNDTKKIKTDFISSSLTISSIGDSVKELCNRFSEFNNKAMKERKINYF